MNFSEFKKLIGADPGNQDPETLRARQSAPEFEAAAKEAEAFEEKLQGALEIQAPDDLLSQIKGIGQEPVRKRNWVPLAMAASLLVFIGGAGLAWKQMHQWESVEAYVMDHYSHDGSAVLSKAGENPSDLNIAKVLAKLDASAGEQLYGRIEFIKHCPTPEGLGAHMIVSTDQGPMTIIYMPNNQVPEGEMISFDQTHALLVNLEHGSAAIIGEGSQSVDSLVTLVRESLKTGLVDV